MIDERLDSERVCTAQVIVSPMRLAGESKNQDRAGWHAPTATACVADGVTDSPLSHCAAELAVRFGPLLFGGPPRPRLEVLAETLFALRAQARRGHVALPPDTLPAMREVLTRAAQAKLAHAFQTTLVAARFTPGGATVAVNVIRCGDSSFFAFARDGTLLAHTFPDAAGAGEEPLPLSAEAGTFGFGPGDTLVARVLGTVAELPLLLPAGALGCRNPSGWLICVAVEVPLASRSVADSLWLRSGDLLLVPHYLARRSSDPQFNRYCHVLYSPRIRLLSSPRKPAQRVRFDGRGCATALLPDDVSTGRWEFLEEHFPRDTHFVLASDGFTGCFADSAELWSWLHGHRLHLQDEPARDALLAELHARRQDHTGDDDISLVYVYPAEAPRGAGSLHSEEVNDDR